MNAIEAGKLKPGDKVLMGGSPVTVTGRQPGNYFTLVSDQGSTLLSISAGCIQPILPPGTDGGLDVGLKPVAHPLQPAQEMRNDLAERRWKIKGTNCPCCGQRAKVYPYSLHDKMATALILLHRLGNLHAPKTGWVYFTDELMKLHLSAANLNYYRLKHWGLVETATKREGVKKVGGKWRLTPQGRQFVLGEIRVPLVAYVYDNRRIKYGDETADIFEVCGNNVDYKILMEGKLEDIFSVKTKGVSEDRQGSSGAGGVPLEG